MKEVQVWDGDGVDRDPPAPLPKHLTTNDCVSCGRATPYAEATLIDPFELEVHHTEVKTWLCQACAYEKQRDV